MRSFGVLDRTLQTWFKLTTKLHIIGSDGSIIFVSGLVCDRGIWSTSELSIVSNTNRVCFFVQDNKISIWSIGNHVSSGVEDGCEGDPQLICEYKHRGDVLDLQVEHLKAQCCHQIILMSLVLFCTCKSHIFVINVTCGMFCS